MFLSLRSLDQQLQLKNFLIDVSQSSYNFINVLTTLGLFVTSLLDIFFSLTDILYCICPGRNSYHLKNWTRLCGEFIGMRRTRLGTWSRILCHWDLFPTMVRRGFQLMASRSSPCCGPIRQLVVADPHCDNRSSHSLKVSATDTCKLHTIRDYDLLEVVVYSRAVWKWIHRQEGSRIDKGGHWCRVDNILKMDLEMSEGRNPFEFDKSRTSNNDAEVEHALRELRAEEDPYFSYDNSVPQQPAPALAGARPKSARTKHHRHTRPQSASR